MKQYIFILFALAATQSVYGQTIKDINALEAKNQACLDSGINMLGCEIVLYTRMDSLLNLAFKNVLSKLDSQARLDMRKDERTWLAQRDAHFKKLAAGLKAKRARNEAGKDDEMVLKARQTDFIEERVKYLIKLRMKLKK